MKDSVLKEQKRVIKNHIDKIGMFGNTRYYIQEDDSTLVSNEYTGPVQEMYDLLGEDLKVSFDINLSEEMAFELNDAGNTLKDASWSFYRYMRVTGFLICNWEGSMYRIKENKVLLDENKFDIIKKTVDGKRSKLEVPNRKTPNKSLEAFHKKEVLPYIKEWLSCLHSGEELDKAVEERTKLVNQWYKRVQEDLRELQQLASLNKTKREATLVFSALPEDILTASDNGHNWTSCYSTHNENALTPVEYLRSGNVFIGYLVTKKSPTFFYDTYDKEIDNKLWRVWMAITDARNIAIGGSQYPYTSKATMSIVEKNLKTLKGEDYYLVREYAGRDDEPYYGEEFSYVFRNNETDYRETISSCATDIVTGEPVFGSYGKLRNDDELVCPICGDYVEGEGHTALVDGDTCQVCEYCADNLKWDDSANIHYEGEDAISVSRCGSLDMVSAEYWEEELRREGFKIVYSNEGSSVEVKVLTPLSTSYLPFSDSVTYVEEWDDELLYTIFKWYELKDHLEYRSVEYIRVFNHKGKMIFEERRQNEAE